MIETRTATSDARLWIRSRRYIVTSRSDNVEVLLDEAIASCWPSLPSASVGRGSVVHTNRVPNVQIDIHSIVVINVYIRFKVFIHTCFNS